MALPLLEMFEDSVAMVEVGLTAHHPTVALHRNLLLRPLITLNHVHTRAGIVYSHQIHDQVGVGMSWVRRHGT